MKLSIVPALTSRSNPYNKGDSDNHINNRNGNCYSKRSYEQNSEQNVF